jgi:hypothetical protein
MPLSAPGLSQREAMASAINRNVLQNSVFTNEQNFPEALMRLSENYEGSHDQSDFQPAARVGSLQGIGSPKTRSDRCAAKFCC